MTTQLIIQKTSVTEQQFILPGRHSWQQFTAIQTVMENAPGLKISYLDGVIEFLTTGEAHEMLKKAIAILLESYLLKQGINFIPVGNATREDETIAVL